MIKKKMFISIAIFTKSPNNKWMHEINMALRNKYTGTIVHELNKSPGFVSRNVTITNTVLTVVTIFESSRYYYDFLENRTHVLKPF